MATRTRRREKGIMPNNFRLFALFSFWFYAPCCSHPILCSVRFFLHFHNFIEDTSFVLYKLHTIFTLLRLCKVGTEENADTTAWVYNNGKRRRGNVHYRRTPTTMTAAKTTVILFSISSVWAYIFAYRKSTAVALTSAASATITTTTIERGSNILQYRKYFIKIGKHFSLTLIVRRRSCSSYVKNE